MRNKTFIIKEQKVIQDWTELWGQESRRNSTESKIQSSTTKEFKTEQSTQNIDDSASNIDLLFSKDPFFPDSNKNIL